MNSSTKVFSVLSLSAAIGKILSKTEDDRIIWRGKCLHEAGFKATESYPFPALTNSKVKQVERKVSEVCSGDDLNIIETLSFLICGLVDLRANINRRNWACLDPVLTRAQWAMDLFDGNDDHGDVHEVALAKYEVWIS